MYCLFKATETSMKVFGGRTRSQTAHFERSGTWALRTNGLLQMMLPSQLQSDLNPCWIRKASWPAPYPVELGLAAAHLGVRGINYPYPVLRDNLPSSASWISACEIASADI